MAIAWLSLATSAVHGSTHIVSQGQSALVEFAVTDPIPVSYGTAVAADFDQDGNFELVLSGLGAQEASDSGPVTQRYAYNGLTTVEVRDPITGELVNTELVDFSQVSSSTALRQVWKSAMAVGDYNGDNLADLAVSGLDAEGNAILSIYEYIQGLNQFRAVRTLGGLYSGDLAWGDVDNDGDQDLAACGLDSDGVPRLHIFVNESRTLALATTQTVLVGISVCSIEWGDYDADGDMDLVTAGLDRLERPIIRVYDNDGAGGLVGAGHDLEGLAWPSVAWGDFDADGDLDLLHSGARFTPMFLEGVVKLYVSDSGNLVDESSTQIRGAFENDPATGRYDGMVSWGDFRNRGYPGFAITGLESPSSAETLQLYLDLQGGGFQKSSADAYDGGVKGAAIWADFDGDLDLDLLLVGELRRLTGVGITYFRNNAQLGPRAPSTPTEAQTAVNGRRVTFSWASATDPQTPAPGLTYNLRVGTSPGGSDVMSPLSSLESGARFVSSRGNAGHNNSWTLRNLSPGTYYWSVQAVDAAYAGSEFSEEQSFTIGG